MSKKIELCSIDDIPDELLDDIGRFLKCYSTALIMKTMGSDGQESIRMIGSGTFVSISKSYGILTAAHVIEELIREKTLGRLFKLQLIVRDYPHSYLIPSDYLKPIIIAKGQIDSKGPDLGFIVLPDSELKTIKISKNFHNLDLIRERIFSTNYRVTKGLFAICGVPDEKTTDTPRKDSNLQKRLFMLVGFGVIQDIFRIDDYDYCDLNVNHDISPMIPDSFGGISGGGLWHITLKKSQEGKIEPVEYILFGVAFYQTERTGLYRSIRCHGPNSIYELAYSAITENRKQKTENRL